ncbi:disulfide bond formation protein B [Legionella londiniensis]|uniref:Disulfide bond formation protein B n=1 Tax=Legionella londiniensis TaxID=45068 RepID=A0A0W0VSP5_9GAMM|nr:disulfide bond formation protein B [Legionella londiniensis]KTD23055.1 disulfide bond formation protein DsbB [Legionella londiniensis]STX94072.1 Disulfide bond formation protein B (Disulfide oxidoreductase) [Legionella londiniensis]
MSKRFYRNIQALLLLLTLMVIGEAFYFQFYRGLEPCPLCVMQRICAFLLGMLCLMGLCLSTLRRARTIAFFQIFFALSGLYFSLRQIWLQQFAEDPQSCMPGLDILMRYFPWQDVARALFLGSGSCSEVTWQWLGLSMPMWAALYFLFILFASVVVFWRIGKTLDQIK